MLFCLFMAKLSMSVLFTTANFGQKFTENILLSYHDDNG